VNSSGALALADIPARLLVVGGGYVGLELGSLYASLGSRVTVVENNDRLMTGADADLAQPLSRQLGELFQAIHTGVRVVSLEEREDDVEVTLEGKVDPPRQAFDRVLVAIGRSPNSREIGLEHTRVTVSERGFIQVDEQRRTSDPRIFAIGDVVGGAMLAHKAMYEGKVAAEAIAGKASAFDVQACPPWSTRTPRSPGAD
jgi:dihydrolipoamide dehydrogenase